MQPYYPETYYEVSTHFQRELLHIEHGSHHDRKQEVLETREQDFDMLLRPFLPANANLHLSLLILSFKRAKIVPANVLT
jgi:hypothetical protein